MPLRCHIFCSTYASQLSVDLEHKCLALWEVSLNGTDNLLLFVFFLRPTETAEGSFGGWTSNPFSCKWCNSQFYAQFWGWAVGKPSSKVKWKGYHQPKGFAWMDI